MDGSRQLGTTFPDEQTLQAWEEMRIDILHELQEGASEPDDLIDLMGELVVVLKREVPAQEPLTGQRGAV